MMALLKNPEVANDTKRLLKKIDPKLNFPELVVADELDKFRKEQAEKDAAREETERVKQSNASYESTRGRLLAKGFDIKEVEKVMQDRGIANYDTAAEFMENSRKLAAPTPESLTTMEMPANTDAIQKMGIKKWRTNEASTAVSELIRARRA